MGSATDSDFILQLVWVIDGVLFVVIALLLLFLLAWRVQARLAARREERLRAVWEPLLIESLEHPMKALLCVHRSDWVAFLKLWNFFTESLKDPARAQLHELARAAEMQHAALTLLRRGNQAEQMVALTTLGQLREESAWLELLNLAHQPEPLLSLAAAKALLRIDAARAIPLIIALIPRQSEWSAGGVAAILKEVGPEFISQPLTEAAVRATTPERLSLIRYFSLAWQEATIPALRQILPTTQEPEVITACLRVCNDPGALDLVRQYLEHSHWQVRLQAILALGRLGTFEDAPRVIACLQDREWWIRHRAAQTLARLPGITSETLDAIANAQTSPFAHDAIRQAQAELQLQSPAYA